MPTPIRLLLALALVAVSGCTKLDTFVCAESSECVLGGVPGTCEPGGLCSFPEPACASGKQYGDFAGGQSGQCVGAGVGTTGATGDTTPTGSISATDGSSSDAGTTIDFTSTTQTSQVTATTTDATETTADPTTRTDDPTATTAPGCSEVDGPCGGMVGCCGPCAACIDGTCVVPQAPGDVCPECQQCQPSGYCGETPINGPCKANCGDIVYKQETEGSQTVCLGFPDFITESTCNKEGKCRPPNPDDCPEPDVGEEIELARCDTVCILPLLCVPGEPADDVTLETYCARDMQTAGCKDTCGVKDMLPTADHAFCDAAGKCAHNLTSCPPYTCDAVSGKCRSDCTLDTDCVNATCLMSMCVAP